MEESAPKDPGGMKGFPFTEAEWSRLSEAALATVNATFAGDEVLRASQFEELLSVLSHLRSKYGGHPALLETEADFTEEPAERVRLYEAARRAAEAGGWVTYSIRISLAGVLLEGAGGALRAMQELEACRDEVADRAGESERQEWQELKAECARRASDVAKGGLNRADEPP